MEAGARLLRLRELMVTDRKKGEPCLARQERREARREERICSLADEAAGSERADISMGSLAERGGPGPAGQSAAAQN